MGTSLLIEVIASKIFVIRGKRVMVDRDLAQLYGVETRVLNQAVRRNRARFPSDFMFPLTRREIADLSQIVISPTMKHAPNVFVFTQEGVAMLSGVLRSKRAVRVNIQIMRAFVKMREWILANRDLALKIQKLEEGYSRHDSKIKLIFDTLKQLLPAPDEKKRVIAGFRLNGGSI